MAFYLEDSDSGDFAEPGHLNETGKGNFPYLVYSCDLENGNFKNPDICTIVDT